MLTSVLMNSIISKLSSQTNRNINLIFNSDAAVKQQEKLKKKILDLYFNESSFVVLGTFLQNINLELFTEDELKLLLSFDYASINATKVLPNETLSNLKAPFYDLDNTIINMPFYTLNNLNNDFKKLHSINKNLNLEYLISYLINQI
jgi:hypothetical protein